MGFGGGGSVKVAKSVPATSLQNESVQAAGDDTRRRLAAANSRDRANSFWTSLVTRSPASSAGQKKTTLG